MRQKLRKQLQMLSIYSKGTASANYVLFLFLGVCEVVLTRRSASLAAENNHVLCFLLKWTILKGKTLLDVVSSAALITLQEK